MQVQTLRIPLAQEPITIPEPIHLLRQFVQTRKIPPQQAEHVPQHTHHLLVVEVQVVVEHLAEVQVVEDHQVEDDN